MRVVKGDLNMAVSRNNCKKRALRRWLNGHIKEPYEKYMASEPDRRSNFFFSLPAHLFVVTYACITEILLDVMLNNPTHFWWNFCWCGGLCYQISLDLSLSLFTAFLVCFYASGL